MANWRKTIDIKRFLNDDELTDREAALKIVETLEADPEFAEADGGLLLDELRDAAGSDDEDSIDFFDDALNRVYDFADERRIWLGI